MKNIVKALVLIYALTLSLTSCSDWTEVEGLNITPPDIATQNPELYANYLKNLREYKNSDHKLVYAWFDNSEKVPFNRSHHMTDLPDSIDVVSLMHPAELTAWELEEMQTIRNNKGTKVIYTVDFDAIKNAFNAKMEIATPEEVLEADFEKFLADSVNTALSFSDKYNYDGICVGYNGKGTIHMTEAELEEYTSNENLFMGLMSNWYASNNHKIISFAGKPQNLLDKSFLNDCHLILLSEGLNATNEYLFSYNLLLANVEGVPTDRFAMMASTTSLDPEDIKTGYFSSGERSLRAVAEWAAIDHSDIVLGGIGIYNISTDYYNPSMIYPHSRYAISTVNPSIK